MVRQEVYVDVLICEVLNLISLGNIVLHIKLILLNAKSKDCLLIDFYSFAQNIEINSVVFRF